MLASLLLILCVSAASASSSACVAFLETNRHEDGVIVTESGMQYRVITRGTGTDHPTASSPTACHYEGHLHTPDGRIFDSSYARGTPATFRPNQVIPGWEEAMQMMVEGDVWMLYLPSELGYGDRGMLPVRASPRSPAPFCPSLAPPPMS